MGDVLDIRTGEVTRFETEEEKDQWREQNHRKQRQLHRNGFSQYTRKVAGSGSLRHTPNQNAPQSTIYQCLDGAMVIEEDGHNPKKLTMERSLSEFKDSPIVKLKDMTLEMVEHFISHPIGVDTMMGISPMCPARNIAFDRDSPRSYSLITLVAMAASLMLANIEGSRPKGTPSPKDSLSELMYQVALIREDGHIFPYE